MRAFDLFKAIALSAVVLSVTAGCGILPKEAADAQSQGRGAEQQQPPAVEVAIARTGKIRTEPEYTGTTLPLQEVSLRAQVEGRILKLLVDVGDRVKQGQVLAQQDNTILRTALNQEQAELAALKAEVARARNQVSNAKARVEQARLEFQQAQSDSQRQQQLVEQGAVAEQAAEQARTNAQSAGKVLRATEEEVRTEEQAVAAASDRVNAQQAAIAQAQEQLSYANIRSPINGVVTQKVTEEGNFLQANGEVLRLGDFRRVKVNVEISELALANLRVGQTVRVRLDAFPNQTFTGKISRISPAADRTARLVPIEVIIPNDNGRIGSGLLARVSFESNAASRVVVPETAVVEDKGTRGQGGQGGENSRLPNTATVFIITGEKVAARSVKLGERTDGRVEILSGLQPGERFVAKSGRLLKNGETVRLSVLSETQQQES
ncbi:efflux RND transporter periplasmic adaptor subunit [Chroococcidiopsis sp. FACHB-1243]|uniref:efflux RND transporter periplasmic adaptor subunit n=1 Tax=Chroococcidiopsis sp. [FACHB-1243] TaxID=2692781 RepID=UPI00177D3AA9|nr:efflux RND transporter periplasmic adaptor subunit [Chroococcidiopsis sp. [FACHB-1243]]MBD2309203.1 efflux RND transporter periplasmic adaptor subunit [Chroococcidiopsis sp. [FACHB-1243]]